MRAVLLLQCPDEPGIVAAVGAFVSGAGGNIVEADQHSDPAAGLFLQRVEFDVDATRGDLAAAFTPIAERFGMRWDVHDLGDHVPLAAAGQEPSADLHAHAHAVLQTSRIRR